MTAARLPRLPLGLGLAGLLPFLALAGSAWLAPLAWQLVAIPAFLYYSAVILSFLGGVQWGVAMSLEPDDSAGFRRRLALSMAPSLIAWPALLLHPATGAWVLIAGFLVVRLHECGRTSRELLPTWYQSLRTLLTVVVVACHGLVIWRLAGG
ncbi:DUF3429 domain-containing protein [Halomonas sp. PGE1]|uniref:DUF3429 domain-containing protein n=1 Tax=Halomonas sp. PGE1 TaxID=2730360 RepID=UPI001472DD57|nr:DUF3429 domain-containing protein [Halomonas sp. PGE1]QJQ98197.1 DUF3429 domain-containing protein [Halomonas sp. PGE1]